jgi:stage II sporulation protein D
MAVRGGALTLLIVLAAASVAAGASATEPVVISGVGAAHGFGLAMDGVEGQARAGWSHTKILDLFYPGTTTAQAGGTIRVGLADGPTATLGLPNGGVLADAPRTGKPTVKIALPAGTKIGLRRTGTTITVTSGIPPREAAPAPKEPPAQEAPPLIPTPPPAEAPVLAPTATPAPKKKTAPSPASSVDGVLSRSSVWLWGNGDPALVSVAATGRRYRGQMEVKPGPEGLVVVNHVPLDTYVAGIAEEKGQGWPIEGMKVLAIAARSLGAATMTWYHKNRANGYDICPTENCQVYLGYDGEEPLMQRAVNETAGQIRTHNGRPILAMYHGNGGGQTESYAKVIDNGTDPYPYLRSVKYPHASPSTWEREWTMPQIETSLRDAGVAIPAGIERISVAKRGESPRVLRLRIEGSDASDDVSGTTFANALDLPSTWFDLGASRGAARTSAIAFLSGDLPGGGNGSTSPDRSPVGAILTTMLAGGSLFGAVRLRRRAPKRRAA